MRIKDSDYLRINNLNIIPAIFITNECIFKIDSTEIPALASNILVLTKKIISATGLKKIPEIQIDCDWTVSTKEKYFLLLNKLQELEKDIPFSATIRLHQIKFSGRSGIPPVRRGMLMCYNMGNLRDPSAKNSILDNRELQKYTGNLQSYPLELDVALPLFEWKVLFRNSHFKGLVENLPDEILPENIFSKKGNLYTVLKDTVLNGYEFKAGDILRSEVCSHEDILKTAELVWKKLKDTQRRVSLYHLDTLILRKYNAHEMEDIYDGMR